MSAERWLDQDPDPVSVEVRQGLDAAARRTGDEMAHRRVWARIAEPQPRRPARRWPIVAGTLAAAAGALVLLSPRRSDKPPVDSVAAARPSAPPARQPAASLPEPAPPSLAGPGIIRTEAGERLRLALLHGAEMEVGPSSAIAVDADGTPTVRNGEAQFHVDRRPPGERFVVAAGPYHVEVAGTRFTVAVRGGRVAVEVAEGVVEIWRSHRLARLGPGDEWSSPLHAAEVAPPASAPPAAPATPGEPAPAARPAVPADPSAEARAALAAGRVEEALRLYRVVAAGRGPAAETAGYEVGRILAERQLEPRLAVAAWERYRADHPHGLLRAEADLSILETLASLGDAQPALIEARAFLERHPASERRAEVAKIAGDLERARGDCRAAASSYEVAAHASPSPAVAEHAAFYRAVCLAKLGDARAADEVQAYLHTYPSGRHRAEAERLRGRLGEPER